jgi:WD40 repeat protein
MHREIRAALELDKRIHVVLTGNAEQPDPQELPDDIAPAFTRSKFEVRITSRHEVEQAANRILSQSTIPSLLSAGARFSGGDHRLTPEETAERMLAATVPILASYGWSYDRAAFRHNAVAMMHPDTRWQRFRFDFEEEVLVLEEYAPSLRKLGLCSWIARQTFSVSPYAPEHSMIRLPDRLIEAMHDPSAYLRRVGRINLDAEMRPPMSTKALYRATWGMNSPNTAVLDLWSKELSRVHANGGLRLLDHAFHVGLKPNVEIRTLLADTDPAWIFAATNKGLKRVNIHNGDIQPTAIREDVLTMGLSKGGRLAGVDKRFRLFILDRDGARCRQRQIPYSLWRRWLDAPGVANTLSWNSDGTQVAICASDYLWVYNVTSDVFTKLAKSHWGRINNQPAFFDPSVGGLLFNGIEGVQRISAESGSMINKVDFKTSLDRKPSSRFRPPPESDRFSVECMAFSPDGQVLALAGDDARLLYVDAESMKVIDTRLLHAPKTAGGFPGEVTGLVFSHDSQRLASMGNDQRLVISDVTTCNSVAETDLDYGGHFNHGLCWSYDDSRVAVAVGHEIEVWEA